MLAMQGISTRRKTTPLLRVSALNNVGYAKRLFVRKTMAIPAPSAVAFHERLFSSSWTTS